MKLSPPSPISKTSPFWHCEYYSGCGNFFLIAYDPENIHHALSKEERASYIASSNLLVDGLLFLGNQNSQLVMNYFNSDGSEASMCGNGLRSIAHFAYYRTLQLPHTFSIQTKVGSRNIVIAHDQTIMTDMGPILPTQSLNIDQETLFFTNTGVPHALFVLPTLPKGSIDDKGRYIRFHPSLGEEGANVSFASYETTRKGTSVHLRTYERGVERETGACGTGACAAAAILHDHFQCSFPFTIHFASNESALIEKKEGRYMLTASCKNMGIHILANPLH